MDHTDGECGVVAFVIPEGRMGDVGDPEFAALPVTAAGCVDVSLTEIDADVTDVQDVRERVEHVPWSTTDVEYPLADRGTQVLVDDRSSN
jgi:hypothetical protein